jgi:hypothetical protein
MPTILDNLETLPPAPSPKKCFELIDFLEDISIEEMVSIPNSCQSESRKSFRDMESGSNNFVPLYDVLPHHKTE